MAFGKKEAKPGTSATGAVTIFKDGLVHATVYALSLTNIGDAWNRGNALDAHLVDIQQQGAEILGVMPYVVTGSGKDIKAIITFRAPR